MALGFLGFSTVAERDAARMEAMMEVDDDGLISPNPFARVIFGVRGHPKNVSCK